MSSGDERPLAPAVERLVAQILRPLFEADGGKLLEVRRTAEDAYVLVLGGSYVGCPAVQLMRRFVLDEAFEKALGHRPHLRIEIASPTPE